MPYRVYFEAEILRLEFSGHLTKADLVGAWQELEVIERERTQMPNRICDLSGWESSENRFAELFEVARHRQQKRFPNAFKSAFVSPQETTFGIARMFQTMNDNPQITTRIFSELAAAQAWLAEG